MGLDERAPTPPHPSLCPGRGGSPAWTHTPPLSDPQHFPSPIKSSLTDPPALCQPHQLLSSAFSPLHSLSHFCFQAPTCPTPFQVWVWAPPATRPHCCLALVPPSGGPPCSRGHVLGARNREAVKAAMMSRFPATAKPSVATVPARPRGGACVASQAWRDSISASTASSWKWVPSTAQMWKSWWLWPVGKVGRSGHIPIPRAAPTHPLTHGKSPHHLGLLLPST